MALAVSEHDRPLHDDVRFLASSLGDVVRRFEGEQTFGFIEELRVACRNRRRGDADAATLEQLLARVEELPLEQAVRVARAFVLFFVLINTAEQVHRVRLWQAQRLQGRADDPQAASAVWALKELQARGKTAEEVREALRGMELRPVLTAHPTEATRRTTLQLQSRVARLLLERDDGASPNHEVPLEEVLRAEIELLWVADEVRRDRPSVLDEVSSVVWYLEHRLLSAVSHVDDVTQAAFRRVFGASLGFDLGVSLGSWVGGDRDGNPFVTPETTLAATRRTAHALLGYYRSRIDELIERLAVSDHIATAPAELRRSLLRDKARSPEVWERNRRRDAHEPVRLKLSFVAARLEALQKWLAARDAGRLEHVPGAYRESEELLADLKLVDTALATDPAATSAHAGTPLRLLRLSARHPRGCGGARGGAGADWPADRCRARRSRPGAGAARSQASFVRQRSRGRSDRPHGRSVASDALDPRRAR
jgi:phosphoenolpyruvate carboxylase